MTDWKEISDPEKLRAVLRKQFPSMADKDIDQVANNEELAHMLELTNYLFKWHKDHVEIVKAKNGSAEAEQKGKGAATMIKVMSTYLIGYVNLDNPLAAIKGARAISAIFEDVWSSAVATAVISRYTGRH